MKSKKRGGLFKNNIRFYVLGFSLVLSILLASWLRIEISGDKLYYIRLQQVYGFAALTFWYFALLATPLGTVFGKEGRMRHYLFSRRALGVSAAYFASLHVLLSLSKQLGGLDGVWLTPDKFQQALLFGAIALTCLLAMAATSFDRVINWMTFPRWKWLHRLGYVGAVLLLLHIWIIGTHLTYSWVRWVMFGMLALLFILEAWRLALIIEKKSGQQDASIRWTLFLSMVTLLVGALVYLPIAIESYHGQHDDHHAEASP